MHTLAGLADRRTAALYAMGMAVRVNCEQSNKGGIVRQPPPVSMVGTAVDQRRRAAMALVSHRSFVRLFPPTPGSSSGTPISVECVRFVASRSSSPLRGAGRGALPDAALRPGSLAGALSQLAGAKDNHRRSRNDARGRCGAHHGQAIEATRLCGGRSGPSARGTCPQRARRLAGEG